MGTGDDAVVTAVRRETAGAPRARRKSAGRAAAAGAAVAVTGAMLFLAYLRVSWTVAATSDGAAQALQAWDMLAGNWLLHGWTLSDVSFYPTELPEYVAVELIRPFGLGVIHVAAALTYTLLVLAVVALARGRATGRAGVACGLLAGVIMLAPQSGYGAFVLLLSPDHVGTEVPLLAGWLLLDRAPRRWWVPALLCLLLAVVQVADRVALLTAVLPLIVVCVVTLIRRARDGWFELALVAAGVASVVLAWAAARLLAAAGGFAAHPFPLTLAPLWQLWTHTWLTGWGVLELYGANFVGVTGPAGLGFAALHLIGLTLAIVAVAVTLWRFVRLRRPAASGKTLVESVLAVAVVANLVSYLVSTAPGTVLGTGYDAREIAAVLPLGAVLAGRVFGPVLAGRVFGPVLAGRVFGPVLAASLSGAVPARAADEAASGRAADEAASGRVALAGPAFTAAAGGPAPKARASGRGFAVAGDQTGSRNQRRGRAGATNRSKSRILMCFISFVAIAGYASGLGYSAAQAGRPGQESALAGWLVAHGLRYGLGQSSANVVTVDSGGRTELMPVAVRGGRVRPLLYQAAAAAYDPRLHDADFLVSRVPPEQAGEPVETVPYAAVRATFGPPARSYRFAGYTVLVWDVNLLTTMAR